MRARQLIHDPRELLSQGRALVKENPDIKFAYRVTMVTLILSGISARELAEHCGDGETTLMSWVKKADENGWDSLRAKKQTGQPRRLTDEQIAKLKENVCSNPNSFGFKEWDGPSLSKHIKDTFDIELGVRACQKLFHKMGFALIRPQTSPSPENPDEEARNTFKKTAQIERGTS